MTKKNTATVAPDFKQWVETARQLRDAAQAAEDKFLAFLYDGEGMPALWQASGMTFPELIERENLCKASRYLAYKRTRGILPAKVVEEIGAVAAVTIGNTVKRTDAKQASVIANEMVDRTRAAKKTNGALPTEQTTNAWAGEIKTRLASHRSGGTKGYATLQTEADRLRAENADLTAKNAALRAEVKALKHERDTLKKEVKQLRAEVAVNTVTGKRSTKKAA